jgi:signal transduction histidine kinase
MTGLLAGEIIGRPQEALERRLCEQAEDPERWAGLEACFMPNPAGVGGTHPHAGTQRHLLVLKRPREAVLELVGVASAAASVSRLLYARDVTHEIEVDRMKSEFLSHAAHELRTPMASIFGFTELLIAQEFDDATRKDLLATIHTQTAWLVDIINELLDLARIESRRGKDFHIEAVPLAPLVREVTAAMQIDVARWPIGVDCGDDLPPVRADAAKLRQALTNVLGNAVKYSPQGGAVDIRCGFESRDGKPFIGIRVTDHGIGMTPAQAARVGERFYRADTSGNIPGTGLGVTIVKEIVELHGGSLAVSSTKGVGTTMTLWLPAAPADGSCQVATAAPIPSMEPTT